MEYLVGGEGGAFVGEVEVGVGEGAGAAGGEECEGCVVDEEDGWGVGRGARVDEVAAEGAAILVGEGAGPAGGLCEEGEVLCDGLAAANVGEGGGGAEGDLVGFVADEAEIGEVGDGEEGLGREAAGVEGDHEFGAAGEEGVLVGMVA